MSASTFATATPRREIVTSESSAIYRCRVGTTLTGIDTLIDPASIVGVEYVDETMGETTRVRGDNNKTLQLSISEHEIRARKMATLATTLASQKRSNQAFAQDLIVITSGLGEELKWTAVPNETSQKTEWCIIHDYIGEDNGLQRDVYPCMTITDDVTQTDGRDVDLTGLPITLKAKKIGNQPLWTTYAFADPDAEDDDTPGTP